MISRMGGDLPRLGVVEEAAKRTSSADSEPEHKRERSKAVAAYVAKHQAVAAERSVRMVVADTANGIF